MIEVGDEFESNMSGSIYKVIDIDHDRIEPYKLEWEAMGNKENAWIEEAFLSNSCTKLTKTKYDKQKQSLKV